MRNGSLSRTAVIPFLACDFQKNQQQENESSLRYLVSSRMPPGPALSGDSRAQEISPGW